MSIEPLTLAAPAPPPDSGCLWCGDGRVMGYCSARCRQEAAWAARSGLVPWPGTIHEQGLGPLLAGLFEDLVEALLRHDPAAVAFLFTRRFDHWCEAANLDVPLARVALFRRWQGQGDAPVRFHTPCQTCGSTDASHFWGQRRMCRLCELDSKRAGTRRRKASGDGLVDSAG